MNWTVNSRWFENRSSIFSRHDSLHVASGDIRWLSCYVLRDKTLLSFCRVCIKSLNVCSKLLFSFIIS